MSPDLPRNLNRMRWLRITKGNPKLIWRRGKRVGPSWEPRHWFKESEKESEATQENGKTMGKEQLRGDHSLPGKGKAAVQRRTSEMPLGKVVYILKYWPKPVRTRDRRLQPNYGSRRHPPVNNYGIQQRLTFFSSCDLLFQSWRLLDTCRVICYFQREDKACGTLGNLPFSPGRRSGHTLPPRSHCSMSCCYGGFVSHYMTLNAAYEMEAQEFPLLINFVLCSCTNFLQVSGDRPCSAMLCYSAAGTLVEKRRKLQEYIVTFSAVVELYELWNWMLFNL